MIQVDFLGIKWINYCFVIVGNWISVLKSFDNCLLQLTDVPKDKTNDELRTEIMRVSRHVAKVMIVVPSDEENLFLNRYCLVMYATHR